MPTASLSIGEDLSSFAGTGSPTAIAGETPFAVAIGFRPERAVVEVRGELDLLTAMELGALLDAVVDRGHTSVILDMVDLDFIDAAGLGVIVRTSGRLRSLGGGLTLRSPSSTALKILHITGLSGLVQAEPPDAGMTSLGPEQEVGDGSSLVGSDPGDLVLDLARVAAIPAGDDVVDAALRLVVALASATVGGADGVSVTLKRHGKLTTAASSDDTIAQMDRDQYATGQGPCLAAAAEGHWFHVESLAEETRWPDFVPRAVAGGINSILSTPLMAAGEPVGALNIYSTGEGAFGAGEQELAALFATQASRVLTDASVGVSRQQLEARLQDALRSREVIARAQGVVMERNGVSADEASSTLRLSARQSGTRVRQCAVDIVESTRRDIIPSSRTDRHA